jgi:hypothetical protein
MKPAPVTAVGVTQCGNFALVGSEAGRLDRYNLQSGRHRAQYLRPPRDANGTYPSQLLRVSCFTRDCNGQAAISGSRA